MSETQDNALLAALWRVVAVHGWQGLSMRRLAAEAGLPAAALRDRFATRCELLLFHLRAMDAAVLQGTVPGQGGAPRDRIFDVLMRRIDAMQPHRAGLIRFLEEARRNPALSLTMLPPLAVSMRWMLDAAEIETEGPLRALMVPMMLGVWVATLRAWEEDEQPDLAATMAALDRALDRAEQAGRSLRLLPRGPAPTQA